MSFQIEEKTFVLPVKWTPARFESARTIGPTFAPEPLPWVPPAEEPETDDDADEED